MSLASVFWRRSCPLALKLCHGQWHRAQGLVGLNFLLRDEKHELQATVGILFTCFFWNFRLPVAARV